MLPDAERDAADHKNGHEEEKSDSGSGFECRNSGTVRGKHSPMPRDAWQIAKEALDRQHANDSCNDTDQGCVSSQFEHSSRVG